MKKNGEHKTEGDGKVYIVTTWSGKSGEESEEKKKMKKNTYKIEVDEKVYLKLKSIQGRWNCDPMDQFYSKSDVIWELYKTVHVLLGID